MAKASFWSLGAKWRSWLEPLIFTIYLIMLVITVPICVMIFRQEKTDMRTRSWLVAGIFVVLSLPVSFHTILQHLIHYTKPSFQLYIIRILWMPPIYSVTAWLSLGFQGSAIFFESFRQCYEAYVVYNFMRFLLNYLEEKFEVAYVLELKDQQKHLIPIKWILKPWPMGSDYLMNCKLGTLQYCIIMPVITGIAFICEYRGVYHEGTFDATSGWTYLIIFVNLSQFWAMYCLIMFYLVFKTELAPINPFSKFLCVKLVVFASFWQQILIAGLANTKITLKQSAVQETDVKSVSSGLQNICICGEMVLASIAHHFAFSYKPYINLAVPQTPCCSTFWGMFSMKDVTSDVMEQARTVGNELLGLRTSSLQETKSQQALPFERSPSEESTAQLQQQSRPLLLSTGAAAATKKSILPKQTTDIKTATLNF